MNEAMHSLIAYMATLFSIVLLVVLAAIICLQYDGHNLAQIVAALGFISAAVTGLIGVIGTFRPRAATASGRPADLVNVKQADE